jgi:hypothetical protein
LSCWPPTEFHRTRDAIAGREGKEGPKKALNKAATAVLSVPANLSRCLS